jgi:hypothetical protein
LPSATLSPEERLTLVEELISMREAERDQIPEQEAPSCVEFLQACRIEDKETGALIPFRLWPMQREVVEQIDAAIAAGDFTEVERILDLKSRQLGASWLFLGILLYLGSFWGHRLFLIVSQSGADAQAHMHRLKVMRESVAEPRWRRGLVKDNTTELVFDNGSRYEAGKATKRYGRGKAAFAALADEMAFWDWPEEQMASLEAACKILFGATTGNGPGDYTHRTWMNAKAGRGRWKTIFWPWHAHPDRDEEWYRLNVLEATEPRLARREYAATAEEAFAAPDGVYFERFDSTRNTDVVTVVPNWSTVRCADFGYRHPAAAWIQTSPAGQPFVVAEYVPKDKTTEEFIAGMKAIDAALGLVIPPRATYCDPAGNAVNVQTSESEIQKLAAAGLAPISKASSVRDGCVRLMSELADPNLPLVISLDCPWTIQAFSGVRPDKHRPDLYDDTSEFDHILDALRYWAVNRHKVPTTSPSIAGGRRQTAGIIGRRF